MLLLRRLDRLVGIDFIHTVGAIPVGSYTCAVHGLLIPPGRHLEHLEGLAVDQPLSEWYWIW